MAPETPAPMIIPPAIIPTGPPTTIRAIPAPVVTALDVPAIITFFFFFFLLFLILSKSVSQGVSFRSISSLLLSKRLSFGSLSFYNELLRSLSFRVAEVCPS
jgi:hypothetical protein